MRPSISAPIRRSPASYEVLVGLASVPLRFAAAAFAPAPALACGGFFCQSIPVFQNAERILFETRDDDGTLTVTVEIRYDGRPEGFSWVVPVTGFPALETVPASLTASRRSRRGLVNRAG